uniref:GDT1 family protein n=1 Tax=Chlamydomonas euryale TaxID=1486919 RepID=A0A6U2EHI2_9CHLO|mmetsp:Transcript_23735/g.70413  ORF Transcript_23735/g.70413 Transcript_23735/m.70413 type:complete len:252 (+) Transcript_23735:772-1527(+)
MAVVLVGGVSYAVMQTSVGPVLKSSLVNGPLGTSGFLAAFSLIFLSEIGDKTFFIAALLALKLGKAVSFVGSVASLALMTLISVQIGVVCSRVPDALTSSIPVGELAGTVLLVVFGIKALREGLRADEQQHHANDEREDAEEAVKGAETSGQIGGSAGGPAASLPQQLAQVATLIFFAEWGDRSMLATIALGAAQNPVGVAAGAIAGHALATGIAVLGGSMAAEHVSEKTINIASGVLFILFAIASIISLL